MSLLECQALMFDEDFSSVWTSPSLAPPEHSERLTEAFAGYNYPHGQLARSDTFLQNARNRCVCWSGTGTLFLLRHAISGYAVNENNHAHLRFPAFTAFLRYSAPPAERTCYHDP